MASRRSTVTLALVVVAVLAGRTPFAGNRTITFHDIAPIVRDHCAPCHRPEGSAPFSLLSYDDVRRRATLIARVTKSRYMPPWKPEPGVVPFAGQRRLTAEQIEAIDEWVREGAPQGDPAAVPAPPNHWGGWQLGVPDLIVTLPEAYQLPADGADVFRTFVVRTDIDSARYVRGIEFHSTALQAVHHAAIKVDRTRSSRRLDDDDPEPGYEGGGGRSASYPDGQFLAWTPGQSSALLPAGMGWRLDPGTDLVMELHMVPDGRPEQVRPSVGLYFADKPPTRLSYIVRLGSQTIDIPPGDADYVIEDEFVVPVDVDLLALQPHAHNLAKDVMASARLPGGKTVPLIHIKQWDFRWQDVYRYQHPIRLPRGTSIAMRFTFDNSSANLRNPNTPPRRVTYGQTTASEMANLWLQLIVRNRDDLLTLDRSYTPKLLRDDLAGYEQAVDVTPEDSGLRTELAFLYLDAGRAELAIRQLSEAIRIRPDAPGPRYALGTVFLRQHDLDAARVQLREALRLKPDFIEAHLNLGVVDQAAGRFDDAASSYTSVLRLAPDSAEAHYNLGRVRASQGHFDEAIRQYRAALRARPGDADVLSSLAGALVQTGLVDEAVARYREALRLNPDLPSALIDLAWLLATSPAPGILAPDESVRLAEHLAALTGHGNPTVLDTLAMAYFAAGRVDDAIETARTALSLVAAQGQGDLARRIQAHLDSFHLP
jgi:tetratricopeptide (TPR) repeat protein